MLRMNEGLGIDCIYLMCYNLKQIFFCMLKGANVKSWIVRTGHK